MREGNFSERYDSNRENEEAGRCFGGLDIEDGNLEEGSEKRGLEGEEVGEESEAEMNEEEESEEEESEEEEERKVLPERASRGKRYTQLLGEEVTKDSQFWGHDTWEEEEGDSGWSSEEEKMELEVLGGVDSSTDSEGYEHSDDGGNDDELDDSGEEAEGRSVARMPKRAKGGGYKDPSLFLKSAQKDLLRRVNKKKLKVKKSSKVKKTPVVLEPRSMSVRASTAQKKLNLQESIKKRDEEAQDRARRKESRKSSGQKVNTKVPMTQEERLEACKEIERMNLESLDRLEEYEEQRKYIDNTSVSMRKHLQSGSLSVYVSWSSYRLMESERDRSDQILNSEEFCREMIIYTDASIPCYINQRKKTPDVLMKSECKELDPPRCFVFGTPAKYLDPLTNRYFSNLEAFRILRREYHSQGYNSMLLEIKDVQNMIQTNKKLLEDGLRSHQVEEFSLAKMES